MCVNISHLANVTSSVCYPRAFITQTKIPHITIQARSYIIYFFLNKHLYTIILAQRTLCSLNDECAVFAV